MPSRLSPRAALAVATLVSLALAAPASAADHRVPANAEPFDIPADVCGFPIHVGIVESKAYVVKSREGADGSSTVRITGKFILSFTNTDSGKTIVRDVGGPALGTFYADGSILYLSQGHSVGVNTPADQEATGLPGLAFMVGNFVGVFGSDGSAQSETIAGRVEDGCALLA